MDHFCLFESARSSNSFMFEATVTTGFEAVALQELKDTFGPEIPASRSRGRIFIIAEKQHVLQILSLRSIDNLTLICYAQKNTGISEANEDDSLKILYRIVDCCDWQKAVKVWKIVSHFYGNCFPTEEEYLKAYECEKTIKQHVEEQLLNFQEEGTSVTVNDDSLENSDTILQLERDHKRAINKEARRLYQEFDTRNLCTKVLKYRVSCYRSGQHVLASQDVARHFGGHLQDKFLWVVDLLNYDMEVIVNIKQDELYVGIALTQQSLHRRNVVYFGPTTLRATVCYNLLKMAEPRAGDVVVDPFCGGGSISIEGAIAFPGTYHVCGDIHPKASFRSIANIVELVHARKSNIDVLEWDVTRLPLKDNSIDVVATDLPFGKRSGSKVHNRELYLGALLELARVMRPGGRVVCLTGDKRNLTQAVRQLCSVWFQTQVRGVNIGGLDAAAYVLKRTCQSLGTYYEKRAISKKQAHKLKSDLPKS